MLDRLGERCGPWASCFGLTLAYNFWHVGVSPWDNLSRIFIIPIPCWPLTFDFKVKFTGFLICFCVQPITIFDLKLAYHIWHMCLSLWEDVLWSFMIPIRLDLWPQGQIYRFLPWLCVRPVTSVCFDIGIPYLAHRSITIRLQSWSWNDVDLQVKYIALCSGKAFLAHLSWKLKWALLITCRPSSVCLSVCLSVHLSVNFSHFHLLLQNDCMSQFQPILAQSILGWWGFKFVQMKN